ncbi:endonuclease V-like isoform X2 [Myxocyprinus asiaticus]|uniref:endonuclease V-like isoform X2 n=1 Tax=Myxocyprinus asiaticus TaxID=70543 RepID=UPI0022213884|nr:endonuclease V-like isoform X2 [Myxocyprinus asiaticus]
MVVPEEELVLQWEREQVRLRDRVKEEDTEDWQRSPDFSGLERVGGVDLSFIKGDNVNACAHLVVLTYPHMQVYEDCKMVTLNAPYVAGFLGFREAPPLLQALERLKSEQPNLMPQVLFVDGNGLFHYREFGLACHLGVLLELPCVGVAKNLLYVEGVVRSEGHQSQVGESSAYCRCNGIISGAVVAINTLQKSGDSFPLATASGKVLGKALRSSQRSTKPVYVSVGHRISLDTAVKLTHTCCLYRVPEPIRQELNEEHQLDCENSSPFQADLLSNKVLIPLNILRICVCVYMCVCSDYTLV